MNHDNKENMHQVNWLVVCWNVQLNARDELFIINCDLRNGFDLVQILLIVLDLDPSILTRLGNGGVGNNFINTSLSTLDTSWHSLQIECGGKINIRPKLRLALVCVVHFSIHVNVETVAHDFILSLDIVDHS